MVEFYRNTDVCQGLTGEPAVLYSSFMSDAGLSILKGELPAVAAVIAAADEDTPVLDLLNSYRYANPTWEPADLCPLR